MTEQQQYRVIADRDKGDDPQWEDVRYGDLVTTEHIYGADSAPVLVRIERPVPTAGEPDWQIERNRTLVARLRDDHGAVRERMEEAADRIERLEAGTVAHPPTREEIAEVVARWRRDLDTGTGPELEDRLVALIQNGADR